MDDDDASREVDCLVGGQLTIRRHVFTCPNCADMFACSDDVIRHLSTAVTCGQRVVQGLTLDSDHDDPEHEQDGAFYEEYEEADPLDDAEDDDISFNNPPLWSAPHPEQYHPSTLESDYDTPLASVDPSAGPRPSTWRDYHPNEPITHPGGENHLQKMDHNVHAAVRHTENLYYPFASKTEFNLGYWLSEGALLQKEVDVFLHLEHTRNNPPSFSTSKDLRVQIEGLPEVPRWDGLEVVKHLFANPVFAPCMDFRPYREFEGTDLDNQRAYGEFMSADLAWKIQDGLPSGHSFVGVIGASDKTPLTIGTGNKEMHPLLISLANIHAGVRMKATSHAFALVAYLPIPKFLDVSKPVHAILSAQVYHFTISIVMRNLKLATRDGCPMSDPRGDLHMVHTPLVAWIADYPEQLLIACTASKCSPISLATAAQFGDPLLHPPQTRSYTLNAIERACTISDPCNIASFHKTCQTLHLNGVHHWMNGISTLKQLTGREHQDLEKLLPGVIVGAVPNEVACALRAITEFIFQAQNLFIYDETLHSLSEALHEFHHYKDSILTVGGRRGKNGPLNHFQIPKLELMQHVARSARVMGAPYQWSSDITERCHITHVKRPYHMSNRRDFHSQCCRFLNRQEKLQFFQLYTVLKSQRASSVYEMSREENTMALHYPEATWISTVLPGEQYIGAGKPITSLFANNHTHFSSDDTIAILLTCRPHFPRLSIAEASQRFHIPDLCPVLGDLISGRSYIEYNGRQICHSNCSLSFDYIHVWQKFRMQQCSTQDSRIISPARTVQALPPSSSMPFGRGDTVLITHESSELLSPAVSERYLIVQVKAIIQPITEAPHMNQPFLYVEFFNFSHSSFTTTDDIRSITPAPVTDMFSVQCCIRSNRDPSGDIVPLSSVHQVIELIPKFGREVPLSMNCNNNLQLACEFYVNNFADKETFHAILSYQ
ncbi:hypothetical protein F4604DRAFT_1677774 [Suillus subluteus]|nr:hypothetical protein F4604DRAFT_1677774 [Suillus subluteus]